MVYPAVTNWFISVIAPHTSSCFFCNFYCIQANCTCALKHLNVQHFRLKSHYFFEISKCHCKSSIIRFLALLATFFAVLTTAVLAAFLEAVIYSAALPGGKIQLEKKASVKSLLP